MSGSYFRTLVGERVSINLSYSVLVVTAFTLTLTHVDPSGQAGSVVPRYMLLFLSHICRVQHSHFPTFGALTIPLYTGPTTLASRAG